MKVQVYKCDVCGTERKEANHWFLGISPLIDADWISVKRWSDDTANLNGAAKHLCGQVCANKFVDEFLSK